MVRRLSISSSVPLSGIRSRWFEREREISKTVDFYEQKNSLTVRCEWSIALETDIAFDFFEGAFRNHATTALQVGESVVAIHLQTGYRTDVVGLAQLLAVIVGWLALFLGEMKLYDVFQIANVTNRRVRFEIVLVDEKFDYGLLVVQSTKRTRYDRLSQFLGAQRAVPPFVGQIGVLIFFLGLSLLFDQFVASRNAVPK